MIWWDGGRSPKAPLNTPLVNISVLFPPLSVAVRSSGFIKAVFSPQLIHLQNKTVKHFCI